MNTDDRKAKIKTFLIQLESGNILGNQMECLDYIYRNHGATIYDMRDALGMAHQSATPAISNLLDCGIIREIGQLKINNSYYSKYEFEPDSTKQDELAKARLEDKFLQWKKRGRDFIDLMSDDLKKSIGLSDVFDGAA